MFMNPGRYFFCRDFFYCTFDKSYSYEKTNNSDINNSRQLYICTTANHSACKKRKNKDLIKINECNWTIQSNNGQYD